MKTYNVRLKFKNDEEKQSLIKTLELKRDAFNEISVVRFGMKTCNGIMPLHQRSYSLIRKQFPKLPSQFVIKAEQDVISKYKSIRSNKHKIDEPVKTTKLNVQLDKRIFSWIGEENKEIKLTTVDKRITVELLKYKKLNELLSKFKMKDPSLFVNDKGTVFLSLVFDDTVKPSKGNKTIGIDLGLKRLVASSEGYIIKGNEFNKTKRKIRYNKRKLQSKSRNSHSARTKLLKLKHREQNFSKNYIHHVANLVLNTTANVIALEDLSQIKRKNKGKKFNNRLSQMPFFALKTILSYKAAALGKRVELVKPHYTSQLDYRGLENGKRKGCRYYGIDGKMLDADLNAANNIALRNNKHSITCSALDGQVSVNKPNVSVCQRQIPIGIVYDLLSNSSLICATDI